MNDNGTLSPGERFDRIESGMQDFRAENQKHFGELKDILNEHIIEDRAMGTEVKAALRKASTANSRLDDYEKKFNKTIRKAGGAAVLMLIVFNYDKFASWIKALF